MIELSKDYKYVEPNGESVYSSMTNSMQRLRVTKKTLKKVGRKSNKDDKRSLSLEIENSYSYFSDMKYKNKDMYIFLEKIGNGSVSDGYKIFEKYRKDLAKDIVELLDIFTRKRILKQVTLKYDIGGITKMSNMKKRLRENETITMSLRKVHEMEELRKILEKELETLI